MTYRRLHSRRTPPESRIVTPLLASMLLLLVGCRRGAPATSPLLPACNVSSPAVADTLDGRRWLLRDADVATAHGAGPLFVVASDVVADGDRVGAFVAIPQDQCIVAYARGSFGIDDLDLYSYADDGTVLAADEAADPHPAIGICSPHQGRAYVAARVVAGRGVVAVGVHVVPLSAMASVSKALGVHAKSDRPPPIDTWPGLSETIAEHRRDLGGSWTELRRVAVVLDARAPTRLSVPLDAARCLDTFVVPADEISQLDVVVLDDREATVGRAVPVGRNRSAVVCSPINTTISIELRPHVGDGISAVVFGESTTDLAAQIPSAFRAHELAPTLDVASARSARNKELNGRGYSNGKIVASGNAVIGKSTSHAFEIGGGCTRLDLIAGKPLAGLLATIYDDAGDFVSEGESGIGPTLFACGRSRRVRIDIEATSRPGPFAIESRRQSAASVLVDHPVAAGRLLGLLEREAGALSSSAGPDAKLVHADPSHVLSFDSSIAGGACTTIAAALDKGGLGIDLRVFDTQSGDEQARSHGRSAVSVRICAPAGEPEGLRTELRTTAGPADALIAHSVVPDAASQTR